VGFALHNTSEGFAIAAPMSRGKPMIGKLFGLGLIAGAPAIFGAWIGGFLFSPFTAIVFLSIGAGAIFQVIVAILRWIRESDKALSSASIAAGVGVGMLIMYLTSILV
jgi:zinc transporter ZupT